MNVSYRDISYKTNSPAIDTTDPQLTCFLGNRFAIQQHSVSPHHNAALLQSRIVDYTA